MIASIATGIAMFGASVFLSQYMQLARGATPTEAGLMTIPMIAGLLLVVDRRRRAHHAASGAGSRTSSSARCS